MKTKKVVITISTCILGFVIFVSALRYVTYQTVFNEDWHTTLHQKLYYYERLSYEVNEKIKGVLTEYQIPNHMTANVVQKEDMKAYVMEPIKQLTTVNRELSKEELAQWSVYLHDQISVTVDHFINRISRFPNFHEIPILNEIKEVVTQELVDHIQLHPELYKNYDYLMLMIQKTTAFTVKIKLVILCASSLLGLWLSNKKLFKLMFYGSFAFISSGVLLQFIFNRQKHPYTSSELNLLTITEKLFVVMSETVIVQIVSAGKFIVIVGAIMLLIYKIRTDVKTLEPLKANLKKKFLL